MADMNIPANDVPAEPVPAIAPPTRTDDQILPLRKWMLVDKNILIYALQITPINDNNPFVAPPSSDAVIEYVNTLGYPYTLRNVSAMSVNHLYQPWRAIFFMINIFLTGKTSGHDRPRHHVLQILWEKAENAFTSKEEDHSLLIPSIKFTKLIIHYLKTKHNIHPRTGSPLHYSHEDNVLGNLRTFGKDGREVFEHSMAKEEAVPESLAPKATKVTKPKAAMQTKPSAPKATKVTKPAGDKAPKPTSSQLPKPTVTPTKSFKEVQGKKHKLVKETSNAPSPAKQLKAGNVAKKRKSKSPLKLVDEFVDEGVPVKESAYNDEEENFQQAMELSLKEQEEQTYGPAHLVVFREPDLGRFQPLLEDEVQGSSDLGKARKVIKTTEVEQTSEEKIHEEFTSTMCSNVQDNLKLPVEEQPRPDDPNAHLPLPSTTLAATLIPTTFPTFTTTITPTVTTATPLLPPSQPTQSTTNTSIESRLDDAFTHIANLVQRNLDLEERLRKVESHDLSGLIEKQIQGYLQIAFNFNERINKYASRLSALENLNISHKVKKSLERDYSNQLLADLDEARRKKKKKRDLPRTPPGSPPPQPPPSPLPIGTSGAPGTSRASGSSQLPPPPPHLSTNTNQGNQEQGSRGLSLSKTKASTPQSMAWTTSNTRYESVGFAATQETSPTDYLMNDDSIPDEHVHLSNDEDTERPATLAPALTIPSSNVSKVKNNWATALVSTYVPLAKNSLLAKTGDTMTFINWYCQKVNKTMLTQADFKGHVYEVIRALYPNVIHLQFKMEECHKMLTY
nr:hypothetical protein [Tanacetum cinerariifolium]